MSRRTADRIAYYYHNKAYLYKIIYRVPTYKPQLNTELIDLYVEFSEWDLARLNKGIIFVFCNKT